MGQDQVGDLAHRHRGDLVRFACALGLSRDDAEDIVQEVFLSLLVSRSKTRSIEPGYLFRAVRYRAHNFRRNRSRFREAMLRLKATKTGAAQVEWPDRAVLRQLHLRRVLGSALLSVPVGERRAWELRELCGLPDDAIADALGISVGAVVVRIHRARCRLRQALSSEDYTRRQESDVIK